MSPYVVLTADPRGEAIVATLTDDEVRAVLNLTHQAGVGTADEPFIPEETPLEHREWLVETFTLSLGADAPAALAERAGLVVAARPTRRLSVGRAGT